MDEEEARRRFGEARVARLATVGPEGRPHLVPVTFALRAGAIVTAVDHKPKRSTRLKRLSNIAANPAVCLLVDEFDENWDRLWWVRADGDARIVQPEPPEEAAHGEYHRAVEVLRHKYPRYRDEPPDGPVIMVAVGRWRGWRAQ